MTGRSLATIVASLVFSLVMILPVFGQDIKLIQLPKPALDKNKSLAQALENRKTTRSYDTENLSDQTLSNLLWAAFGINRPDSGRRTAPSAKNWQEIAVYVATPKGMYLYDAKAHSLLPIVTKDIRPLTYTQAPFKEAPIDLVYVADLEKMGAGEEGYQLILAGMDTGFIAENVYLFCAAEGLNTGFRVSIDREKLIPALHLNPAQRIMGAQSVGLPKSK